MKIRISYAAFLFCALFVLSFELQAQDGKEEEVRELEQAISEAEEDGEQEKARELREELKTLKEEPPRDRERPSKEEELKAELTHAWKHGDDETAAQLEKRLNEMGATLPEKPSQDEILREKREKERPSKREELKQEMKNARENGDEETARELERRIQELDQGEGAKKEGRDAKPANRREMDEDRSQEKEKEDARIEKKDGVRKLPNRNEEGEKGMNASGETSKEPKRKERDKKQKESPPNRDK